MEIVETVESAESAETVENVENIQTEETIRTVDSVKTFETGINLSTNLNMVWKNQATCPRPSVAWFFQTTSRLVEFMPDLQIFTPSLYLG